MNVISKSTSILLAVSIGGLIFGCGTAKQKATSEVKLELKSPAASATPQPSVEAQKSTAGETPEADYNYTWKVGGPAPDGKVVFADWEPQTPGSTVTRNGARIYLLSDYGFMLINEGSYKHPKAVYLLGFLKQKKIRVFRSFVEFKNALRDIPRGSKVCHHDVCTAGTAPGIDYERTWKTIKQAFKRAHLKFNEEDNVSYCVCPK
jgi:hypothetical protein